MLRRSLTMIVFGSLVARGSYVHLRGPRPTQARGYPSQCYVSRYRRTAARARKRSERSPSGPSRVAKRGGTYPWFSENRPCGCARAVAGSGNKPAGERPPHALPTESPLAYIVYPVSTRESPT
jgi:hypothetical protein